MQGSSAWRVGQEQSLQLLEMVARRVATASTALRVIPVRTVHLVVCQTVLKQPHRAQRAGQADFPMTRLFYVRHVSQGHMLHLDLVSVYAVTTALDPTVMRQRACPAAQVEQARTAPVMFATQVLRQVAIARTVRCVRRHLEGMPTNIWTSVQCVPPAVRQVSGETIAWTVRLACTGAMVWITAARVTQVPNLIDFPQPRDVYRVWMDM